MSDKYRTLSAVMLLLEREQNGKRELLLQKRYNTGYIDGRWDCAASGHVEKDESMKMAVIREAEEELGIKIPLANVHFATLTHKHSPDDGITYYDGFFVARVYEGGPKINEPNKCSAIEWFEIDKLPADVIPSRVHAIGNYLANMTYDEIGWESN